MAEYAIGDVQGCFEPLQRLLDHIHFNENEDRLWFVGDLVNRGPQSLEVLRFVKSLPLTPRVTLGNHDLHLLGLLFVQNSWKGHDDTLQDVLKAEDGEELGHWLRRQSILYYSSKFNVVMVHAGIAPIWNLYEAMQHAQELEGILSGENYLDFLNQMYGNEPNKWSDNLNVIERLRLITNYFTRMRLCNADGSINLSYKGTLSDVPPKTYPWFSWPERQFIEPVIIFGHWAALEGKSPNPKIHAIDTGCLWGGQLTALRLEDKQRFAVWNKS